MELLVFFPYKASVELIVVIKEMFKGHSFELDQITGRTFFAVTLHAFEFKIKLIEHCWM